MGGEWLISICVFCRPHIIWRWILFSHVLSPFWTHILHGSVTKALWKVIFSYFTYIQNWIREILNNLTEVTILVNCRGQIWTTTVCSDSSLFIVMLYSFSNIRHCAFTCRQVLFWVPFMDSCPSITNNSGLEQNSHPRKGTDPGKKLEWGKGAKCIMSVESLLSRERKRKVGNIYPFPFSKIINPVNFLFLPGEESEKVERRECITLPVLPPYGRQPQ